MRRLTESERERRREHLRRRFRRRSRRAYIRSAYSLPSLATLGNAICGFGAMYVASLVKSPDWTTDAITQFFADHRFVVAAYLVFMAMVFDGLDGRLARFTRHTTEFGGQLDSLADVISFGAAPAFLALQLFRSTVTGIPITLSRLIWAVGALFVGCAAIRLAKFNVSNEHGEQHHFSFLGLPSPGAAAAVAAFVLMQQEMAEQASEWHSTVLLRMSLICVWLLPIVVLCTGLLMVSNIRYPHLVNRYLRGKRSLGRVVLMMAIGLLFVVAHRYVLAAGTTIYALWGPAMLGYLRLRRKPTVAPPAALPAAPRST